MSDVPISDPPRFIIDAERVPEKGLECLIGIEEGIHKNPEAYLQAIGTITVRGEKQKRVIDDTWEAALPNEPVPPEVTAAHLLVGEYVEYNYGKAIEFDEASDDALEGDPVYLELQVIMRSLEGARREEVRKKVSRQVLRFFTERVIEWQGATSTAPLPKAS